MIIKIFKGRTCFSHLAGEESEAQRGWAYAQASQLLSELRFEPRHSCSRDCVLKLCALLHTLVLVFENRIVRC